MTPRLITIATAGGPSSVRALSDPKAPLVITPTIGELVNIAPFTITHRTTGRAVVRAKSIGAARKILSRLLPLARWDLVDKHGFVGRVNKARKREGLRVIAACVDVSGLHITTTGRRP